MSRDSAKCRRIVVDAHAIKNPAGRRLLQCHVCGGWIDVLKEPKRWRADHIRRYAEGGADTADNLFAICIECDGGVDGKAADDTREVAKGKRVRDSHDGIRKSRRPMRKAPEGWDSFNKCWRQK